MNNTACQEPFPLSHNSNNTALANASPRPSYGPYVLLKYQGAGEGCSISLVSHLTPVLPVTAQPGAENAVVQLLWSQRWPHLRNRAIAWVTYGTEHLSGL